MAEIEKEYTEIKEMLSNILEKIPSCLSEIPGGTLHAIEPLKKIQQLAFINPDTIILESNAGDFQLQVDKFLSFYDKNYTSLGRSAENSDIEALKLRLETLKYHQAWTSVLQFRKQTGRKFGADLF